MTAALLHLTGALADRYRIERELGQGGMATVYLAHDLRHNRQVAVKVLRPELAAVIGADRFLAEITTTANLQHPHILPLFDSGEADGFLFYVMPFVEGETLRDRLHREKQLPIADSIRIANEVAAALDYAHRHGVIHRDIKPENILLHDGSALVADFGIALAASRAGTRMTETGMSLGTPHYMSPEQAMGEREITARSDVYALGAITYEMLLGEPPFTGPTAQAIVAKVMSEKPARLMTRRDRITAQVEEAVLTALEKLPADRFASAAEFALALRAPAATVPAARTPARATGRPDWRLAAAAGAIAGAALASGALLATRESGPSASTVGAALRIQLTFNGRSRRPAISPDGDYLAYVDERCPRGPWNPCAHTLLAQDRGSDRPVAVLRDLPSMGAPRFTRDGLSVLVEARLDSARAGVYAVPRLGGLPRLIAGQGPFDTHARGDSAIVVSVAAAGAPPVARIVGITDGRIADSIVLPAGNVHALGWSPDGARLALVEGFTKLTIVRRDGTVADSLLGPFRPTVRWTPDGRGILVFRALPVKEDDLIYLPVDRGGRITGPSEVRVSAIQTLLAGEFDVAQRTGQVVVATGSATFDIWTFDAGERTSPAQQRTFGTTWYSGPAISPDGTRLYYQRGDAAGDNVYELTLPDTEEPLTADRYPGAGPVVISRDGRRVVFGNPVEAGMRFGSMDLATRQATFFFETTASENASPTPRGRGFVFILKNQRGLGIREAQSSSPRELLAPAPALVAGFSLDASEDSVAVLVRSPSGMMIGITPLGRWDPRWLHTFAGDEATHQLTWSTDGSIYFWLWRAGEDAPGVWAVPASGGIATRRRDLPAACNLARITIALSAPRGACTSRDTRGDIWMLNVPGVTR